MKLKKLEHCSESSYLKYYDGYRNTEEAPFSDILMDLSYESWIKKSGELEDEKTLPVGYVPSHTYFLVNENDEIVGNVSIRIKLNEYLRSYGGHIGYIISPKYRGKKYGKMILALALKESKSLGITKVLLTCDKENTASSKIIIENGGVLESEYIIYGVETQKYWINL